MTSPGHFWDLDPAVVHLNHGSFGACPEPVLAHQTELRREMERNPVDFLARRLEGLLDEARLALAGFVGADPAAVAFVPNATTGVNAIVGSLALDPGDEIVVTNHGYNACRNVVDHHAARAGATVRVATLGFAGVTPDSAVAAIVAAVTERTRLVIVDHVTSPTALVLPVARIAAALEPRGVPVLVDGAHGPGMLAVDVAAIGASYYVGNCHKWMCAPKGSGFLAAAAPRESLLPAVISHGWNSVRSDRSRFHLLFDWTGTDDPTAYLCVPTAIDAIAAWFPGGWEALRRHNRELALTGRRIVAAAIGVPHLPPDEMIGSMAAIPLPPGERFHGDPGAGDPLGQRLREAHHLEVPVPSWPQPPQRVIRISAQAYNRVEDFERLAAGLRAEGVAS